jgi:hypothetical protein
MAFKYNSLGTGKSLKDVAASSIAAVLGPNGKGPAKKRKAKGGTRHGAPKKIPTNAADAKRAENAAEQRTKNSKQRVADEAGRAPARPPINPGKPNPGKPKPGGKK